MGRTRLIFVAALLALTAVVVVAGCAKSRGQTGSHAPERAPAPNPTPTSAAQPAATPEATPRAPLKLPLVEPRIVVSKSRRRLSLYSGGELVRTYRVVLGFEPVADKIKEGDGATPEGEFYVFTKNDKSQFYLSLGVSYPNAEDAERGLRDGLINKNQYQQIVGAIRRRAMPPQYTPLGGLIYIHGGGVASDWTGGCVALENSDMKELFDAVPAKTTVRIEH